MALNYKDATHPIYVIVPLKPESSFPDKFNTRNDFRMSVLKYSSFSDAALKFYFIRARNILGHHPSFFSDTMDLT